MTFDDCFIRVLYSVHNIKHFDDFTASSNEYNIKMLKSVNNDDRICVKSNIHSLII